MLNIARYVGQAIILSTAQGEIVIKIDHLANITGRAQVFLAISAPREVLVTREPK